MLHIVILISPRLAKKFKIQKSLVNGNETERRTVKELLMQNSYLQQGAI